MHVSRPLKDGQKISQGHRLSSLNFIQMKPQIPSYEGTNSLHPADSSAL
jgi:hypothetical protein